MIPKYHYLDVDDARGRIRRSAQTLREWQWIAPLSTDPETLLIQLRREAKALIALGLEHPGHANEIGKLVVAYHRLMTRVKQAIDRSSPAQSRAANLHKRASATR